MAERPKIPRWLAFDWWWLYFADVVILMISRGLHRHAGGGDTYFSALYWPVLQAAWMYKVLPRARASFVLLVVTVGGDFTADMLRDVPWLLFPKGFTVGVGLLGAVLLLVLWVYGVFRLKSELEAFFAKEGLFLSPMMTIFFPGYYFQYHLHRMSRREQELEGDAAGVT